MSFCTDVKNELASIRTPVCCRRALAYGFMLFSRSFCQKKIAMQTVNERMADSYASLLRSVYDADIETSCGGESRKTYRVQVSSPADRLKILASVDFGMGDTVINTAVFERDCCHACFIRGVFLACGAISNPETEYRAEFSVKSLKAADELAVLLSAYGISSKKSPRAGNTVVYIKESGKIEDLLTLMGVSNRSLDIMDTKIIKGVKNNMNRARNCDSANISKTVEASILQRQAIDYLEKADRLESLPHELLAAAMLRKNNHEAALKELCRISDEPITVSGLNHRLQRIIAIYNELKNQNDS